MSKFFVHNRYERLDEPHPTSHGDPWDSDRAYPDVFRWRNFARNTFDFMCIPGLGSFYPHLFLPLAAEFYFRSWLVVFLGIFTWSILVELPLFLFRQYFHILPSHRSLWTTTPIYYKENPTREDLSTAFSYKETYENPDSETYYAVIGRRRNHIRSTFAFPMHGEESRKKEYRGVYKEVYGFVYRKIDIASYILWAILIDILVGIGATLLSYYIHRSFDLAAFRDSADGILILQYLILFVMMMIICSHRGWIVGPVALGYIFAMGAWNLGQDTFSWTPYLVFFGLTIFYWMVFFRNPLSCFIWGGGEIEEEEGEVGRGNSELLLEGSGETGMVTRHPQKMIPVDTDGDGEPDSEVPPASVMHEATSDLKHSSYHTWWFFAISNYESDGFKAFFSSMFILFVVAVIAISI